MGCPNHREHVRNKLMVKAARKQAWVDSQVLPIKPPKPLELPEVIIGDSYYLAGYVDSPAGRVAKYVYNKPKESAADTTSPNKHTKPGGA